MPNQVPDDVKHERLNRLMELQNRISLEINQSLLDSVQEVMVEGPSNTDASVWTGRTSTNKIVLWSHDGDEKPGDIIRVRITQPQTWVLKGCRI